ncbi:uncharacterized protein BDR25DRAFT_353248 [Lindgomyces ingoldianus]|uniref:Uncharacterized protein n=1 Tax=Lindgomyces ingoldianus TaxID=673940 RepID=A0ACB6R0Y1_9PLEO|nr:uncharacterized protein BDR25DRAFT_353248 [Lindgomyces ingoldianus]KAF2472938.1 hypothetical protein BDR25DRAFT_353248 [Lindgomyces ingoldianus]
MIGPIEACGYVLPYHEALLTPSCPLGPEEWTPDSGILAFHIALANLKDAMKLWRGVMSPVHRCPNLRPRVETITIAIEVEGVMVKETSGTLAGESGHHFRVLSNLTGSPSLPSGFIRGLQWWCQAGFLQDSQVYFSVPKRWLSLSFSKEVPSWAKLKHRTPRIYAHLPDPFKGSGNKFSRAVDQEITMRSACRCTEVCSLFIVPKRFNVPPLQPTRDSHELLRHAKGREKLDAPQSHVPCNIASNAKMRRDRDNGIVLRLEPAERLLTLIRTFTMHSFPGSRCKTSEALICFSTFIQEGKYKDTEFLSQRVLFTQEHPHQVTL